MLCTWYPSLTGETDSLPRLSFEFKPFFIDNAFGENEATDTD
jgi:hypothetical protein